MTKGCLSILWLNITQRLLKYVVLINMLLILKDIMGVKSRNRQETRMFLIIRIGDYKHIKVSEQYR
jgi:hypothetical protein